MKPWTVLSEGSNVNAQETELSAICASVSIMKSPVLNVRKKLKPQENAVLSHKK